jgi:hypothetical protein
MRIYAKERVPMFIRSKSVLAASILLAASAPLALSATTGNFTTPLTNAFLSVDLNGGDIVNNLSPTNGWNENTTTGGFSADNFGILWTGWGGPQYSGGDGVQLPNNAAATPVNAATITKTFTTGGSAYYGVTNTPSPVVTASLSINTTTNSNSYGTINGSPSLNSRDRGTPSGANGANDADMFRDFVFAPVTGSNVQSSNYLQVTFTGLTAGAMYTVDLYSYDAFNTKTNNWSATAPTFTAGLTGFFASGTNTFTAPADEQSITGGGGTPTAPASFTLAADTTGAINLYGWGGSGTTGDANADNTYLNGFQIAVAAPATPLLGDATGDGKVDITDLDIVLSHLGETDGLRTDGNFDGAATIDLTDLNDVLNNLQTSTGSSVANVSATPEPATAGMLLAFSAIAAVRRRRA